jgi:hypothetical protein
VVDLAAVVPERLVPDFAAVVDLAAVVPERLVPDFAVPVVLFVPEAVRFAVPVDLAVVVLVRLAVDFAVPEDLAVPAFDAVLFFVPPAAVLFFVPPVAVPEPRLAPFARDDLVEEALVLPRPELAEPLFEPDFAPVVPDVRPSPRVGMLPVLFPVVPRSSSHTGGRLRKTRTRNEIERRRGKAGGRR